MITRLYSPLSLFLLAAITLGLLTNASLAQPRPFIFGCGRYYASWLGRPWSYDQQCWNHMVNIGVTLTGTGLAWSDLEPTQGEYNWDVVNYADFAVSEIRSRGMEPFFFLGLTPQWAALRPDLPPHRTPPAEEYVEEFKDYCRFVAQRYKGQVKYYTFWNEPNGCSWINDGCSNADSYPLYTRWLIRCSQAVKEVDPDAKIIAGNLDYHIGVINGWQYVQGMYDYGAGPYIDGIAIHPYDQSGTINWQAIRDTRAVMVANGDADKGIWLTEYGWNYGNEQDLADRLTYVLNELKKPEWSYVVAAIYLVLNDGPGVENYGLMDINLNPRLRYYAFRDVDKTFADHVDFSADVTEGPIPLTVHFTDESSVEGAYSWLWEFGDGQTSNEQNPTHTYTEDGLYTVRLTVTGTNGPVTAEKPNYIRAGNYPPIPGVDNPSFEENGGSYEGWEIVRIISLPDNPPLDNTNTFGPHTPFGDHFGGKITNGMPMGFYLGQVIGASNWDEEAPEADWQLDVWVQLYCMHEGNPNPTGVHQIWEIGWNDDGSEPTDIMSCDNYQVIASIDGTYTDNDTVNFYKLSASGTITGVSGLRGVAVRVYMYNDAAWWWTFSNIDNLDFHLSSIVYAQSPAGFYKVGWNLISIPIQPSNPEASAVFQDLLELGNVLEGNLYRYEPGVGYLQYPYDFTQINPGIGYWLYLSEAEPDTVVNIRGQVQTEDARIPLVEGWNLIGFPFLEPVPLADCQLSDGVTVKSFAQATEAGWIQPVLYYLGSGYKKLALDGGDDDTLRPWHGYWFLVFEDDLQLIIPKP